MGIDQAWTGDGRSPGHWRDTSFRLRGPSVAGLRAAFAAAWVQTPHALLTDHDRFPAPAPAGGAAVQVLRPASQPGWNDAALALVVLLHTAQDRVRIATPYARLPARLLDLLVDTARRGVQVQLLLSGPHVDRPMVHRQGRRDYQPLLDADVAIWHYQPSLLHTKLVTVDSSLAMVGTVNVDTRSLALNEQVALNISDAATTGVLDGHYDEDLAHSRRISPEQWRDRGARQRFGDAAADVLGRPARGAGSAGLTGHRP